MDALAENFVVAAEMTCVLRHFKDMRDNHQSGMMIYSLDEILLLCLLAAPAGSEASAEIARFGEKKLALLRRFRPFKDGTPAHDHLGEITWAKSSPTSTPRRSIVVSCLGRRP